MLIYSLTAFTLAVACLYFGTRKPRVEPKRFTDDRRTREQMESVRAALQTQADTEIEREYDKRVAKNRRRRAERDHMRLIASRQRARTAALYQLKRQAL